MYALLVFAVVMCAAQGHLIPQIIGGKDAPDGKYPYQVSIKFVGFHTCGGSIIDARNILTAAHCVKGRESNIDLFEVHAGTNKQNESGTVYTVASITIHKHYDLEKKINDIALIHLEQTVQFNSKVQPIQLATTNIDDGSCKLTGWGDTSIDGLTPNNLQEIDLLIYPNVKCKEVIPVEIRQSHICTLTKAGEGACFGDSGGPLVANGAQIGIASFVRPCAMGYPDVYTRVFAFRDWIEQNKMY